MRFETACVSYHHKHVINATNLHIVIGLYLQCIFAAFNNVGNHRHICWFHECNLNVFHSESTHQSKHQSLCSQCRPSLIITELCEIVRLCWTKISDFLVIIRGARFACFVGYNLFRIWIDLLTDSLSDNHLFSIATCYCVAFTTSVWVVWLSGGRD